MLKEAPTSPNNFRNFIQSAHGCQLMADVCHDTFSSKSGIVNGLMIDINISLKMLSG